MRRKFYTPKSLLIAALAILTACSQTELEPGKQAIEGSSSTEVTLEEAQNTLEGALNALYAVTKGSGVKKKVIADAFTLTSTVTTKAPDGAEEEVAVPIHIFNFEDDGGYAILSGDKRTDAMLAITESGNIDKSNPAIEGPAGIALYGGAQTMQDQLEDDSVFGAYGEKTPDIPSIAEEKTIWTPWETTKIVKDLCKVKWGQKGMKDFYLYNKYCPSAGGDSMCYAGCIPVSVAHVMSVHKYPSSYKGYTFDWDKLNKFRGEWGVPEEETGEQLAHLLAELGSKDVLHTYYGPNSSGTEFSKITQGFKSFGYSNWGHQEDYIEDHIISELDAGYPVMIGGFAKRTTARFLGIKTGYNYDKGHSWVVHGYMVQERDVKTYQRDKLIKTVHQKVIYMQCNWGWNGKDDGFFLSHAFSPEEGYAFKDDGKTEGDHYASPYAKDYNYQYHLLVNLGMRK